MAVIFTLTSFKQGKKCFGEANTYEVPDDTVGYFKMNGWARDAQEGDPALSAVVLMDELEPHAPTPPLDDIVIQPDNGVLGVETEVVG